MVDLDIPTNNPPATSTLLHWLQTGLTPATSATSITSTTGGAQKFFMLQPPGDPTAAYASYIAPNPPARVPLSHRYTQILVDTSAATTAELNALKKAAANRSGFSASAVLAQANLVNKVVAGNWFVVTNPGPAINSNVAGSGTESTANNISSDASVASESTSAALSSSTSGTSSLNVTGPPANSSSTATGTGTGTSTSTSTSSLPSTTDNDAGAMAPPRGALLGLFCASLIFFRL